MDINISNLDISNIKIRDSNGEVITYNLEEMLRIETYNLNEHIARQPAEYAYWASVLATLRAYLESAELEEERIYADLYEPTRIHLQNVTGSKPNIGQIESGIKLDERYQEAQNKRIYTEKQVNTMNYVVKAFAQKHDMLIQMSVDKRKQLEYENAIKQFENN